MHSAISAPPEIRRHAEPALRTLHVGVIGLGVGEMHVDGVLRHGGGRVQAICDQDEGQLQTVGERLAERHGQRLGGVRRERDAEAVLTAPDIDVVCVATYDHFHAAQVIAALEHGKHVFVEKPLCLSDDEAHAIRAALRARPHLRLSANLVLRACPRFTWLRRQILRGGLGELFHVEGAYNYGRLHKLTHGWRGVSPGYSVVHGGAIHLIDLLLWLTGARVEEVFAVGNRIAARNSQFPGSDAVTATLRFTSGLIGQVAVSYGCVRPHFHDLRIYGTSGTFINDLPDAHLYRSRDPAVAPAQISEAYPVSDKGALLPSFIDAILNQGLPIVGEEDVFAVTAVCLAIERSLRTGQACPVPAI